MNQISALPNPLEILFQEYNQGRIESVGFRSFSSSLAYLAQTIHPQFLRDLPCWRMDRAQESTYNLFADTCRLPWLHHPRYLSSSDAQESDFPEQAILEH